MKPVDWLWLSIFVVAAIPLVAISGLLKKVWRTWKGK